MAGGRDTGSDGSGSVAMVAWDRICYLGTLAGETAETLNIESPHVVSYDLNEARARRPSPGTGQARAPSFANAE